MKPIGRPRAVVADMPRYRPGKSAAQAAAEHDLDDAIKLASNERATPPDPRLVDAVTVAAHAANRYADHRAGTVRAALAAMLGVDDDQVTVGNGSAALLQQLCLAYLDPGDEVVFPWRSFEVYPVFTRLAGATAITVPLDDADGIDVDAVAAAVTPGTKIVFLATPNNPTGVALAVDDIARLTGSIPDDVIVCIDEAYREFVDDRFGDPVGELLPARPNVVVTRTFSKAFALAGLRVGYAVGAPGVIAMLDAVQVPFSVSGPAQAAALAAIEHRDELLGPIAGWIAERDRVASELRRAGWPIPDVQGNFVWIRTGADTDRIAGELERRGVVVRPFTDEGVRVSIGTPDENSRFLDAFTDVAGEP